ncbi:MAG: hypothetical protein PT977_13340 [Acidobacteriota bacterium]|nr:hypothetical protein [Acidobacteriota bacterium]
MKSFARKSGTVILFGLLLAAFRAPSQLPDVGKAVNQAAGTVKKAVDDFFSDVKNRTIAGAGQIGQWSRDAAAAGQKMATDFASCPSPDAQRLYDDLKAKRNEAQTTRNQAAQAVADADAALAKCLRTWPDGPNGVPASPCRATYGGLPFKGIRDSAQAAVDAFNASMNALKALKCITGCNRTAGVDYPSCALAGAPGGGPVHVNVGGMTAAGAHPAPIGNSALALGNGFDVCVEWDPGAFRPVWNPGPDGVQAGVDVKFPKCKRTVHVPGTICTSWDITLILPKLKELKLVPIEVQAGDLKIELATQTFSYVTVEQAASCSQEAVLCTGISTGIIAMPPAILPVDLARSLGPLCRDRTFMGCLQPAFGLVVVNKTASVPDPSQGTVSWKGPKIKAGSLRIDLTRPEFAIACRQKGPGPNTGGAPSVTCATKHLDLPFLCLDPRWGSVVGNP